MFCFFYTFSRHFFLHIFTDVYIFNLVFLKKQTFASDNFFMFLSTCKRACVWAPDWYAELEPIQTTVFSAICPRHASPELPPPHTRVLAVTREPAKITVCYICTVVGG